jgi:putative transposase
MAQLRHLSSDPRTDKGVPAYIQSDSSPEFVAKAAQDWIEAVGSKTTYITQGSPWESEFIESFNARLRDELLDGENFYSLKEVRLVVESWRRHYNIKRPHGSLGYKPPAPAVFVPAFVTQTTSKPSQRAGRSGPEAHNSLTFAMDPSLGANQYRLT